MCWWSGACSPFKVRRFSTTRRKPGNRLVADLQHTIYEALIQANVPPPAARRVAESLEKDMSSTLATKQDLHHLEQVMNSRFDALEARFEARFGVIGGRFDA